MDKGLYDWMTANNVATFKVFTTTDPTGLKNGWRSLHDVKIDAVIFFDGRTFVVFLDDQVQIKRMEVLGMEVKQHRMNQLQSWLDSVAGIKLVGYGSTKFDGPVLLREHYLDIKHQDVLNIVGEATEVHYGDFPRRIELQELAYLQGPFSKTRHVFSYLSSPLSMISNWRNGWVRTAIKELCGEVEMLAGLYKHMMVSEALTIRDERTHRKVEIPFRIDRASDRIEIGPMEEE
jgi:hypothetical protein|tara:strand:+ start:289 stop:987 length:699 start_codon:yes stop_codon:yes gene_type:complete